ncbi:MAG: archease [Desulfobacteraceae bacterium]|jgi:SHS2 domain-containing protein|nr:archease [Desulfobacteraceae bacterium]
MRYRLIDHTADTGVVLVAADGPSLFENAAFALFDLLTDLKRVEGRQTLTLDVAGQDWPDLMVAWLRELLYLWVGRGLLVNSARVEGLEKYRLSATVAVEPFDPERHAIKTEIKAVTYHQLAVTSGPDGWRARIVFDI